MPLRGHFGCADAGAGRIGYMCYFAPPEILEAAGLVPYRIRGDIREPVTHADQYVEPYGCPFVRSSFDLAAKGRYDFLDGLVMAHACDSVHRMYGIWTHDRPTRFTHLLNVPHTVTPWSERFFRRELELFQERVEQFVGAPLDGARLRAAIDLYNANRALIWELYRLRKAAPPRITGTEMLELLIAGSGIPAAEFRALLEEVTAEVTSRPHDAREKGARLLFYGCINDDVTLIRLLEECGADVVMDDTCIGARGPLDTCALAGGGARDLGLVERMRPAMGSVLVAPEPMVLTALGAAFLAAEGAGEVGAGRA